MGGKRAIRCLCAGVCLCVHGLLFCLHKTQQQWTQTPDFKVGKFGAAIQWERTEKTIYKRSLSAAANKNGTAFTRRPHMFTSALLRRCLFIYLFSPAGPESSRARGLVHSWLADGSKVFKQLRQLFPFDNFQRAHTRMQKARAGTFTYIYSEAAASAGNNGTRVAFAERWRTLRHTQGLGKKGVFFVGVGRVGGVPLFATFAAALGLSAHLGVTNVERWNERQWWAKWKKQHYNIMQSKSSFRHFIAFSLLSQRTEIGLRLAVVSSVKVQHFAATFPLDLQWWTLLRKPFSNGTIIKNGGIEGEQVDNHNHFYKRL